MNISSLGKYLAAPFGLSLLLSAGNATAGAWQKDVAIGGFESVHVYTPETTSPIGHGRALLVLLHGCVQPIDNYLGANLERAADEFGMVIALPDAANKAGFSCWSYWQGDRSRTAGDYKNLIELATTLSGDGEHGIDPNQVYIAGVSSGAVFANTTACLAPDVFAGMGISAGPSIGTSPKGALGFCETADVANRCATYAGEFKNHFATQITSVAHGTEDATVDHCYNAQNAEGMAEVYGVKKIQGTNTYTEGERTASETLWEDGRVSMVWLNDVGHAWAGGEGAEGRFISADGVSYARYLGKYFSENNQRVQPE
ncbi:PHB depolymerase family esterase [Microbulbifer agarilyticus]|uniref:extracellular catalytic domain type 1 short-chain-length polyhydroxyalkanoate depolymerase n=1 Tax=Microbulbifer agarilyticus TaxID=260552 RepID=UPI001C98D39C|nr:PHB depolymerase family esterase [Microbulbifer agarilyticus]MBY6192106.1 PHB depolymerase family esterase [Microbulbifer agarilyticus]